MDMYRRMPLVEWQVSAGRIHASPPTGRPHELIGGAAMVWAVLDRPRTLKELMVELIELDPGLDEGQVSGILGELVQNRLVAREAERKTGEIAV